MPIPSTPDVLPSPIGGDTLPITATTPSGTGDLSYAQGWPVLTGLPLEAGGVAPQREFFNAVNALVTKHLFFLQSGGVYPWQAALNYLTGWGVLVDGVGYTALQPSGPDVPEVGPKPPAENPEYWGKTKADVPIATTTVPGIMRFATPGEVAAKEEPNAAVSPKDLAALENRLAYTVLYPGGTAAAPATISANQRIVVVNPCGAVPCRVEAEVKIGDVWGNSGHYTDNVIRAFVEAHTLDSNVIIQSGSTWVATNGSISGSPFGDWGGSNSAPYRLKIWKLAGA